MSDQLIVEILPPQPVYTHERVRNILEDVILSSMMRIDPESLDKLWILTTMIFKWQLTHSPDIVKLTLRHLYEIENYVTHPTTQFQLHRVQSLVRNFSDWAVIDDIGVLRDEALDWTKDFNARIMILMKLGFQDENGEFIMNNNTPLAQDLLKNLGENIFVVTLNGDIVKKGGDLQKLRQSHSCELKNFIQQVLGEKTTQKDCVDGKMYYSQLDKNNPENATNQTYLDNFEKIDIPEREDNLPEIFTDLSINDTDLKEDLLDMIDKYDCSSTS